MKTKYALIEKLSETQVLICSSFVGHFRPHLQEAYPLRLGATLGELRALGQSVRLLCPEGYVGKIVKILHQGPVMYGSPLFEVELEKGLEITNATESQGLQTVSAPMAGVFYRRSAPDQPYFVEEGDLVQRGTTLGLIEQMKSFNRIALNELSGKSQGKIIKILISDQSEVERGSPLFLVEPLEDSE